MEAPKIFDDVDASDHQALMIDAMRQTAQWPATVDLRQRTRPALEVPPQGRLLDVGCGLGDVVIDLAAEHPDVEAVGVDLSETMLAVAREDAAARGVVVDFRQGSATAIDQPDDSFDAVRSERMLQWLPEPSVAVAEMVRVTRPGGRVVLIDTDWRTAAMSGVDPRLERIVAHHWAGRPGAAVGGQLRELAMDAGLRDVQEWAATHIGGDWDPDVRPGPSGSPPPALMASTLAEAGLFDQDEARRWVEECEAAARAGRLHMSLSMFAVVGTVPA